MADKDTLKEALEAFAAAESNEAEERETARQIRDFVLMDDQWPADIKARRAAKKQPMLTINKLPAFVRQVVNDARQNKPSIKITGVDSASDPQTAEVIGGIIRAIEHNSSADIAYDTAAECAALSGKGFYRADLDYEDERSFDMEVRVNSISNPFSVYGDPDSTAHDSSDWNCSFVTSTITKDQFELQYKDADPVDWKNGDYASMSSEWLAEDSIQIAEYWKRTAKDVTILLMPDGSVMDKETYDKNKELFAAIGMTPVRDRITQQHQVVQYFMSGAEILKTTKWIGKFIPIIPVYGEEINDNGTRRWRGLVHRAMDAQRMFNYWKTVGTEVVALTPRVPFIGPAGAFETDKAKWATINTDAHAYVQYDNEIPPQRQPLDSGPAVGAMKEAMMAADDMKAILGIYDAALGQRSNETSGKAIMARQRESDVGTFHFVDNLTRSIRHGGRVVLDLVQKVYNKERAIRILGEDKQQQIVQLGKREQGAPVQPGVYDLSFGKYDLAVSSGPNYTTRRQEASEGMMGLIQAFPQSAPVIADLLAKAQDWPDAEKVAQRLQSLVPPQALGDDPRLQQAQQQMQQMQQQAQQQLQQMQQQLQQLQQQLQQSQMQLKSDADKNALDARIADMQSMLKDQELKIKGYEAETKRMELQASLEQTQYAQANASPVAPRSEPGMPMMHDMPQPAAVVSVAPKKPAKIKRRSMAQKTADGAWVVESRDEEIPTPPLHKTANVQKQPDGSWIAEVVAVGGELEEPQTKLVKARKNEAGEWIMESIEQ